MSQVTLKAVATKLNEGLQVESQARNFKVLLDEPKEYGGTDKGMNPGEMILCALGACQTIMVTLNARQKGIDLKGFTVEVEGDVDTEGSKPETDVRPGFSEIRYKMRFKSDTPQEKLEEYARFIEDNCPMVDTLAHEVKLVLTGVEVEK